MEAGLSLTFDMCELKICHLAFGCLFQFIFRTVLLPPFLEEPSPVLLSPVRITVEPDISQRNDFLSRRVFSLGSRLKSIKAHISLKKNHHFTALITANNIVPFRNLFYG